MTNASGCYAACVRASAAGCRKFTLKEQLASAADVVRTTTRCHFGDVCVEETPEEAAAVSRARDASAQAALVYRCFLKTDAAKLRRRCAGARRCESGALPL